MHDLVILAQESRRRYTTLLQDQSDQHFRLQKHKDIVLDLSEEVDKSKKEQENVQDKSEEQMVMVRVNTMEDVEEVNLRWRNAFIPLKNVKYQEERMRLDFRELTQTLLDVTPKRMASPGSTSWKERQLPESGKSELVAVAIKRANLLRQDERFLTKTDSVVNASKFFSDRYMDILEKAGQIEDWTVFVTPFPMNKELTYWQAVLWLDMTFQIHLEDKKYRVPKKDRSSIYSLLDWIGRIATPSLSVKQNT